MNALAHKSMFQSAYHQIGQPERSFVDRLVNELAAAAKRQDQSIRLALHRPLPDTIHAKDTRGWLDRPLVQAAISEQIRQRADENEITEAKWIQRVHMLGHADPSDFWTFDEAGDPIFDLEKMKNAGKGGIVKSLDVEKSDGLTRNSKMKLKVTFHDPAVYLKMEAAYMGLDDGDSPSRRADRSAQTTTLPATATAEEAGDAYASMIGDT